MRPATSEYLFTI